MSSRYLLTSLPTAGVTGKNAFDELDVLQVGYLTDCTRQLIENLDGLPEVLATYGKTEWFGDGDVHRITVKYNGRQYQIRYIYEEEYEEVNHAL